MDGETFDTVVRSWTSIPRRAVLRAALVAALTGVLASRGVRKVAASCRPRGRTCERDGQCCSGVCKRKRKRGEEKKCRPAFSQGACSAKQGYCDTTVEPISCGPDCGCWKRVDGAAFCGDLNGANCAAGGDCANCPEGTRCVKGTLCCTAGGPICVVPCPNPA